MSEKQLILRTEVPADKAVIHALTKLAFADMEHSAGDEQDMIDALRVQGALALSLVAVMDDAVVGHVAFSPAKVSSGEQGWFALGPVCAAPSMQRQGIGSALIEHGLDMLRQRGAKGCILIGHPNYYPRFGFKITPQLAPENEPGGYFMVLSFGAALPAGRFAFHPAFYGTT